MGEEEHQRQAPTVKGGELLGGARTSATMSEAQFLSWKRRKDAEEADRKAEAARKRAEDIAAGTVQMNGRELFLHEPWDMAICRALAEKVKDTER